MSNSVKIDGDAIRTLRESKELTQLYLATVVEVTTDTISRWENRKYPAIKIENAQKLAEALEVELEEILEQKQNVIEKDQYETKQQEHDFVEEAQGNHETEKPARYKKILLGAGVVGLMLIVVFIFFFFAGENRTPVISAKRFLPEHTAPGLAFPVMVRLLADTPVDVPILIREEIQGKAAAQNIEAGNSKFGQTPRWIGRFSQGEAAFLYLVHPEDAAGIGEVFTFTGDCVSGKVKKIGSQVLGRKEVIVSPYHWADQDKDYQISDNEILDAYESFTFSGDIEFDFSELEEYWLAGRYYWDEEKQKLFPGKDS